MAVEEHISQIRSGLTYQLSDQDPEETQEWMDSFDSLVESQGTERAQFIIRSASCGVQVPSPWACPM